MIVRFKYIVRCLLASVLVCTTITRDLSATEFFVSTMGNDANPGTQREPFATVTRACDTIRALIKQGLQSDVSVIIRGGTYHIVKQIIFGPQDSGTDEFKITYAAHAGETPVISGGRIISNWEINDDGTWQTTLPEVASGKWHFRELFVNGQRRPRCQHPNEGYIRTDDVIDTRFSFYFIEGDIPAIDDPAEAELVLLHDWSISRNRVKLIDFSKRILTTVYETHGDPSYFQINGNGYPLRSSDHYILRFG